VKKTNLDAQSGRLPDCALAAVSVTATQHSKMKLCDGKAVSLLLAVYSQSSYVRRNGEIRLPRFCDVD